MRLGLTLNPSPVERDLKKYHFKTTPFSSGEGPGDEAMPIEIKELHIKASVVDKNTQSNGNREMSRQDIERMKNEIIKACVNEVIQILEDKKER